MKHNNLRRTVLALAVAAASASASAIAVPISNYNMTEINMPLAFTGAVSGFTVDGEATLNADFVEFESVVVTGDVVNNAILSGTADQINGFDLDGSALGEPSIFNGNLQNFGSLDLNGLGANGILLDNIDMNGSVQNNGTINVTGGYDPVEGDGASGIKFWGTHAAGDTRNDGTITVTGEKAKGFQIDTTVMEGYLINGSDGVITVSGDGVDGVSAFKSDIEVLINHGRISADGASASGIDLDLVDTRTIVNSGTIEAMGAGSVGIMLDGVSLTSDSDYTIAQHGIVNSGVITGEKYGISVEGDLKGDGIPLYINMNSGHLSGGEAAIKGQNQDIQLNWAGGTIKGDLIGISDVNVNGYVTFEGENISGNGSRTVTVNNSGFLNLDATKTNITDNLTVKQEGAVRLLVTPITNRDEAILKVGGTATFENGSQIFLEARPYNFAPQSDGTDYLIVEASNIVNNGVVISSFTYLLEVKEYDVVGGQMVAKLAMKDYQVIEEIIEQSGADENGKTAFLSLVTMMSNMETDDPLFQALVNASPAERAVLAAQLLPDLHSVSTQAAIGGQATIVGAISGRTDSLRTSESTGDMLADTGLWFQVLSSDAEQNRRDGIDGYSSDTKGFTLGADGKLNSQWTAGLAYSYLESDVKSKNGNSTDVEGHSLTAYTSFSQENWFADSNITYSKNDNSSKRFIVGTEAKGDYDSDMLGISIEGGYSFTMTPSFALEPLAALRYAAVNIDGYTEKGSSAALAIGSQRYEVMEAGLGLRAKASYPLGKGTFKPETKIMAYHDFAGDQSASTSSFVLGGNAFTTTGAKPVRDTYQAGVGGTYELGNFSLGLAYDYTAKSGFNADTFTGHVRYDF